jgi:hypothetical protein
MSANPASSGQLAGASTRVHRDRLPNDESITDKFADGLARIGVGDLVLFTWINPDFPLATADHYGRKAFLGAKVDPAS